MIAAGLVPLAGLGWRAAIDGLGANPIEFVTEETGTWALRFLMLALSVTPARRLGWRGLAPYRRSFGLLAFFYACLHLSTYIGLDLFFAWYLIYDDVLKRPYITVGLFTFLCMLPLAVTSTRGWIRRLGRRWTRLHRLAYAAGVGAVLHYAWLAKADLREPLVYAAVLTLLLGTRLWTARSRRSRLSPRAA